MKILVACEESQTVCKAFRARGHEAYSADIQEPTGGHPEWHILGDVFEKKTCLWLKGLPRLQPTNIVDIPPRKVFDSGKSMPAWYADAWTLPKEERAKLRSKTFPGIAEAMAGQWGCLHD